VQRIPLAFACLALLTLRVAAQATDESDEPPVELGKIESFGPQGRVFATDRSGKLFLLSRQSYAAEHGAGFTGEFRVVEGTEQRLYRYETVCASERKGYRLVRATAPGAKEPDPAYSASIDERLKAPKPAEQAAYNLYFAACRKLFRRFK
jgi:hypothetical protein